MIFEITDKTMDSVTIVEVSEFYANCLVKGHFVECSPVIRNKIYKGVEEYCSTSQKAIVHLPHQSHLSKALKRSLTTIRDTEFSYSQMKRMMEKPAELLVENKAYEEPVYQDMMKAYCCDDKYGDEFKLLYRAYELGFLEVSHAGGFTTELALLRSYNNKEYKDIVWQKYCVLMDRDTNGPDKLPEDRKDLLKALSGKEFATLSNKDIDTLNAPHVWHMWHKRAIENYFSLGRYKACGLYYDGLIDDKEKDIDWSYKHIIDVKNKKKPGYHKEDLGKLSKDLKYNDFEKLADKFNVDGILMSEFQLFLLKLVRII